MSLTQSLQNAFDAFFGFLPNLLGFLVLLLVGYVVAKVVAGILRKVLDKLGVDRHLQNAGPHNYVERLLPGAIEVHGVGRRPRVADREREAAQRGLEVSLTSDVASGTTVTIRMPGPSGGN